MVPEHPAIVQIATVEYGTDEPLLIEARPGADLRECRGPAGLVGGAAGDLVTAAVRDTAHGPPLSKHVVAGDRVVLALAGDVPQSSAVVTGLRQVLADAGIRREDLTLLRARPLAADDAAPCPGSATTRPEDGDEAFDPTVEGATSYLAADQTGQPLYLARPLVDADVVVAVGGWSWDPAYAGRSDEGELWPTFSTLAARRALVASLARRGRRALPTWLHTARDVSWQLGVTASLRLVAGRGGSLHAAAFGLPAESDRAARTAATGWRPPVESASDVTIAALRAPDSGFAAVTRAVAAASRATRAGGTICVVGRVTRGPGIVFMRWRQGAPLQPLVREAVASGDPVLVADALLTRLFARVIGDRRLVLLGGWDEAEVEDLGFGYAATPEVVERLAHRSTHVAVLHEADAMFPRRAEPGAGPAGPA